MTARVVPEKIETQKPDKSLQPIISWLFWGCMVAAAIILLSVTQHTFTYREIFSDPADSMGYHPFMGAASTLGLFGWTAAAAIPLLTYAVINDRASTLLRRFFLASGLFTLLLLFDDAFMLHEHVLPNWLGIRERYIKAAYLVLAGMYGLAFRKILVRNNLILLAASATFLAMSVTFDNPALLKMLGLWETDFVLYVIEDGAKLVGITLWLAYFTKTSIDALRGNARA